MYMTQMEAAKNGIITEQMKIVAEYEYKKPELDESCLMCGKFCAVRSMNKTLNGEYIDIL